MWVRIPLQRFGPLWRNVCGVVSPGTHSTNPQHRRLAEGDGERKMNKSYVIGYRFQLRVKRWLEKRGWWVRMSPKSSFPDGIAVKKAKNNHKVLLFECKVNKYLSKKEKEKAQELKDKLKVRFCVFYREGREIKCYEI